MQPLVRKTLSCWLFVGTIIIRPTLIEAGPAMSVWADTLGAYYANPDSVDPMDPMASVSSPLDRQLFTQAVAHQSFRHAGDPSSGENVKYTARIWILKVMID